MKNIEDREIISKYLSLRSCRKVAEYYDCGHETVRQVLINHNISRVKPKQSKKEPKYHLNVYTDAELIEAYEKYGSQTLAGEKLGVSQTTVYRALKRNGMTGKAFCAHCGKQFAAKSTKAKYCSKKCKDIAFRSQHGIPCNTSIEPYHKICKVCGKPFDSFRERDVTCSAECAYKYRHPEPKNPTRATMERVNKKHGQHFEYVSHNSKRIRLKCKCYGNVIERASSTVRQKNINCEYCKEQNELSEARRKMLHFLTALADSKTPKQCICCGKEFLSQYHDKKYCSAKCKRKSKGRKNSYRSRCRNYGVYYDPSVTRAKVIIRDNGICQICGKVCDENDLRWGSLGPDFPTLDHIIPLAKGGTHTWGNVQCACAICNSDKRDLLGYA